MRIITGKAKGLVLKTPKGLSTRPTSDRIKESLFSILNGMIDFEGKIILDLFAGTGALGLEAMSRGGTQATFVDFETIDIIRDNVARAHFNDESEIIRSDVFKAIKKFANDQRQFDLIFCDPPYNKGLWQRTLIDIDNLNLLTVEGLLIIEHGIDESLKSNTNINISKKTNLSVTTLNLEVIRQINYGHTTAIEIFKRKSNNDSF